MAISRGGWRMSRRDACLGIFALLLVLRGGPCHAAILVPDDYPTIALGLQHAWVGDTVIVRCGTYTEHGMYLTSGVTLCSETGDPDCVVIDGDYSGSILISLNAAEPVRVEGISLTRGGGLTELAANGGGLHLLNCTAFIKSCNFDSNSAGSRGGGGLCGRRGGLGRGLRLRSESGYQFGWRRRRGSHLRPRLPGSGGSKPICRQRCELQPGRGWRRCALQWLAVGCRE